MVVPVNSAAPFYPPHVKPSPKPLRFPFNLTRLLGNNLAATRREAYRNPVVLAPGPPRMAFITGPDAVKTLLLDRPSEFPKGCVQVDWLISFFATPRSTRPGQGLALAARRRRPALPPRRGLSLYGPAMIRRGGVKGPKSGAERRAAAGFARSITT